MNMAADEFRERLAAHFDSFRQALATDGGDWVVKGFIDVYKNIYTISVDTKVISKIIELMLFPVIAQYHLDKQLDGLAKGDRRLEWRVRAFDGKLGDLAPHGAGVGPIPPG